MRCNLHTIFICFFLLLPLGLYAQDARAGQNQLLLIPEILNDFDRSISNLEENSINSNRIISDLQKTVNTMQTTINIQQRELQRERTNSQQSAQVMQQRSQSYEVTLQSLETSLTALSREKQEKDQEILRLTQINAKQMKWIFIFGGMLVLIAVFVVVKIVIKIKTGGVRSLLKVAG